ncbi:MAG: fumarylacetoacetate hydrolase family protein [Christensenellales bacterium]
MKYVRFLDRNGAARFGILEDQTVTALEGDLFGKYTVSSQCYKLEDVKLLAPCLPSKVIAIGTNYMDHTLQTNSPVVKAPLMFLKATTSVIGPYDDILYPQNAVRVDFECEMGVVISKRCKGVSEKDALDYVLGYTCVNDVSERHMQWNDGQWARGKSLDTFCPVGPVISTEVDPFNAGVMTRLNGEIKQQSTTANLMFNVPKLISYIAQNITLLPGDIISTGTPGGTGVKSPVQGEMNIGDVCEVTVEGVGTIRNRVVKGW